MRRREVLRLAFASILDVCTVEELGRALADVTANHIDGVLAAARGTDDDGIEFAIIAMGRFGGRELGFGSDADVLYVHRATTAEPEKAQQRAQFLVAELKRLTEEAILPLDLDVDLRPEGKNGPMTRSLESYRAYYARWSLTWEAQALLRARAIAGDAALRRDFEEMAAPVRYPDRARRARRPRGPAHQGPRRERATAAGRRPHSPPQARPRIPQRRRVARAAAPAAARARHPRAAHAVDPRGPRPGDGCRPHRQRRMPRPCAQPGSSRRAPARP